MFRPRGFAPPRRFTPCSSLRACCIPQPVPGSQRFTQPHDSTAREPSSGGVRFPLRSSHPSKSFPRQQPAPHHCGPLPSCRYWHRPNHRSPKRAALKSRRALDPVMLRSAEADPHVTEANEPASRIHWQNHAPRTGRSQPDSRGQSTVGAATPDQSHDPSTDNRS
jgi:hypothetical protein